MTVRPIDLQIMMPKTTEVSKIQHLQKENHDAQKTILTIGFQEQLKTSRQKVIKRNKAEGIKIKKEQEKSNRYNNEKSKKQNKEQNKKREQKEQLSLKRAGHHIDIKI